MLSIRDRWNWSSHHLLIQRINFEANTNIGSNAWDTLTKYHSDRDWWIPVHITLHSILHFRLAQEAKIVRAYLNITRSGLVLPPISSQYSAEIWQLRLSIPGLNPKFSSWDNFQPVTIYPRVGETNTSCHGCPFRGALFIDLDRNGCAAKWL